MTDLVEDMARAIKLFGPPSFEGAAQACLSIVCARLREPDEGLLRVAHENSLCRKWPDDARDLLRALADYLEGKGK
jgi:hypothetical protein